MSHKYLLNFMGALNAIGGFIMMVDLLIIVINLTADSLSSNLLMILILCAFIAVHIASGIYLFLRKKTGYYLSIISFTIQSIYLKIYP